VCGCASGAPRAQPAHASAREEGVADEAPRVLADDLWPARVLALLNEHRHEARVAPLSPSSALSEVALAAARECFADATFDEQAVLAHAHAQLERQSLLYRRVSAVVTLADSPADAAKLEAALDPDARNVGIGVARGTLTGSNAPRTAVVLVLATPRSEEAAR
jgi:hypothetical protein